MIFTVTKGQMLPFKADGLTHRELSGTIYNECRFIRAAKGAVLSLLALFSAFF